MSKEKEVKSIRVRFAPSPTGPLHIGGSRTALFNYLFAKKNNGKFILRIEDTDLERSEQKWTDQIIKELKWLEIEWDEGPDIGGEFGPYKQTQRLDTYEKYLEKLLREDKAYYCYCTEEELEDKRQEQMSRGLAPKYDGKCAHLSKQEIEKNIADGKKSVIRFRVENKKVKFHDLIRSDIEFDSNLLGDIVIAKNIKTPLYHFAVVVDDFEMQISHVIRGEEHLPNTPRQILIQEALGFYKPIYAHLPLMLNTNRSKLSKRQGDVAVSDYHRQGYLPEALVNFMALLGWNPGTEKEIFSLGQLTKEFSIEKVQKAGAIFNLERLDFINGLYIREKSLEKLTELCVPYLVDAKLIEEKNDGYVDGAGDQVTILHLQKVIGVSKTRMKKLSEIVEFSDFFFKDVLTYDKSLLQWQKMTDGELVDSLSTSEKVLSGIDKWNLENLEKELLPACTKFNIEKNYPEKNKGYLLWPLRVALSGKSFSPGPFEIAEILGKEKTLKRIAEAKKVLH
jgi:nondiscriminating glutamyl-tRNA synthetase